MSNPFIKILVFLIIILPIILISLCVAFSSLGFTSADKVLQRIPGFSFKPTIVGSKWINVIYFIMLPLVIIFFCFDYFRGLNNIIDKRLKEINAPAKSVQPN